jgi:hypothetical protein
MTITTSNTLKKNANSLLTLCAKTYDYNNYDEQKLK